MSLHLVQVIQIRSMGGYVSARCEYGTYKHTSEGDVRKTHRARTYRENHCNAEREKLDQELQKCKSSRR